MDYFYINTTACFNHIDHQVIYIIETKTRTNELLCYQKIPYWELHPYPMHQKILTHTHIYAILSVIIYLPIISLTSIFRLIKLIGSYSVLLHSFLLKIYAFPAQME
jgi:hypothetical protein